MRIHVDRNRFTTKPTGPEIGGIKARLTQPESIRDLTVEQIAKALSSGMTIQPGVTPFSEESKAAGRKGTVKEDFTEQTLFMIDIDNKRSDVPPETQENVVEVLAEHNLRAAFMYPTFGSTEKAPRFRFAIVSDAPFTDKAERDMVQAGLIALFPQADADCVNADRIFFGTNKGMSYTDLDAICNQSALLAIAASEQTPQKPEWPRYGATIPTGQRHGTLLNTAVSLLKKYGICDRAHDAFMERAAQCEEPKPDKELQRIWSDACTYYERAIVTNPDYIPPEEYADTLKPTDYTDLGEARVFIDAYGDRSRYSAATKWLVYDGKKWNESELKAQGLAQQLTDRQLEEARNMLQQAQRDEDAALESGEEGKAKRAKALADTAKGYRSFVLGRRKSSRITATLTEARPDLEINVQDLDSDPFLLNTPDGTVDLRTGELRPHDPNDFCTKMTAVSPSAEGAELWADFLKRITCGDESLQSYHQICSGMELVGKVFCENLIIAHGNGGNGKSTFYNAKFLVMGDYAGSLSAETLTVNCRKNKSPEYAELRGKRFVIAAELEEGMRLDTAVVKKLCSVDPIKAEKKFKDPFEFLPSHTTILYTNHLPKVGTNDKGTWDRLVVVPFLAKLRGEEGEVKNYADYLFHECGGAILSWMIEGAKRFIDSNHTIQQPQIVKDAIENYRQENDWLNNFIAECCEEGDTERAGDLYDAYRSYCANLNEYVRHISDFKAAMVAAGYTWRRDKTGAHYYGLHLKKEFAPIVRG